MLLIIMFFLSVFISLLILSAFFLMSKSLYWESEMSSSFECGFTSYFFSRFSFSMHYFMIGLIFLFLDLELCFIMPFFNSELSSYSTYCLFLIFIMILVLGLILEWQKGELDWKF